MTELFANLATTTVAVDYVAGGTSMTVDAGTLYGAPYGFPLPSGGDYFTFNVENEWFHCTAINTSTHVWTVIGARDSSAAANHLATTALTATLTADTMTRINTQAAAALPSTDASVTNTRTPTDGSVTAAKMNSGAALSGQVPQADGSGGVAYGTIPAGSTTLAADTDVVIASPADTEVLTYEASSSKWKNKPPTGGSGGVPGTVGTKTQLNFTQATDYATAGGIAANTWTDAGTVQTFTVDDAASNMEVFLDAFVQINGSSTATAAARLLIDGIPQQISGMWTENGYLGFSGAAYSLGSLAAGSHTIKLQVQWDTGTAQVTIRPIARSGYEMLRIQVLERKTTIGPIKFFQQTLTVAAASFSVPAIPAGYSTIEYELVGRSNGAPGAQQTEALLQINGDTGAHYDWQFSQTGAGNTSISGVQALGDTSGHLAYVPTSTAGANESTTQRGTIPLYDGTTFRKHAMGTGTLKQADAGNIFVTQHTVYWRNTAAVTSLLFFLLSGSFVAGSRLTVWLIP